MNGIMNKLKIFTVMFAINWRMDYWVSYSFCVLPFIATKKIEIHEETSIPNNRFDVMWVNNNYLRTIPLVHCNQKKHFQTPLV